MNKKSLRRRGAVICAVTASLALTLAGCASPEQEQAVAGAGAGDEDFYAAAVAEAERLAEGQDLDASVSMIGVNSGVEGSTLEKVYAAFTEGTGTKINYTGSADTNNIVQARVQAGNPPELADIAMGSAKMYAEQGRLMDLSSVMASELEEGFSSALLDAASVDGSVFGIYQGFNNFMLWHNPEEYSGPENPATWDELLTWTEDEAAAGTPAWCAALNSGAWSGAPSRQFIENIFLKENGPELYRAWGEGEVDWTGPEVRSAFEQFAAFIAVDEHVSGGVAGILSTPTSTGYNGLTASPATCQIALWGSWVPGLIGETARPGENIDFFRVPAGDPAYAYDEMFQSTTTVAFVDNTTTQTFMKWLASAPAQTYLASLGQWPVANMNVPLDAYPTPILKKIAETYFGDSETQLRVGPNSLANPAVLSAFQKGVVSFLQDPSSLDSILETIQSEAQ